MPCCTLFSRFLEKLDSIGRRLVERALRRAVETGDIAALYHFSTLIGRGDVYLDSPRPGWPGFSRKPTCLERVVLPEPRASSGVDVLRAIRLRRSRRTFSRQPVSLEDLSTLLFHSVGITGWDDGWPLRAYPSAGGLQPVEAYVVAEHVEGLEAGLYYYDAFSHSLCLLRRGRLLRLLADICLGQDHVAGGAGAAVFTVVYQRTASKYAARGYRYAHVDAGAAIENFYLAAEALGLATVAVGAFYDEELCKLLGVDCYNEFPVAVMPFGHRA